MHSAMQTRYEKVVTGKIYDAMQIRYEKVVTKKMHGVIQIRYEKVDNGKRGAPNFANMIIGQTGSIYGTFPVLFAVPPWLTRITRRINEKSGLFPSSINHVLINEYLPNQGIMPHQDGPAYYPVVAILSLGSPVVIDFTPHPNLSIRVGTRENSVDDEISDQEAAVRNSCEQLDNFHPFSIILMPRSLLIFKDMVYSDYLHGIKDSEVQGCNKAVNVTNVQNHGVLQHSSGSAKALDIDDTVICRASTRVSLTCRLVTK
ncbi:ent-kaurenoic acid oxidase family protein, partial [Capsicum annuum]